MKKFLLLFTLIYISIIGLYAQNLSLVDKGGLVINNGDTYTIVSTDANKDFIALMGVKNNSTDSIKVYFKKKMLDDRKKKKCHLESNQDLTLCRGAF